MIYTWVPILYTRSCRMAAGNKIYNNDNNIYIFYEYGIKSLLETPEQNVKSRTDVRIPAECVPVSASGSAVYEIECRRVQHGLAVCRALLSRETSFAFRRGKRDIFLWIERRV